MLRAYGGENTCSKVKFYSNSEITIQQMLCHRSDFVTFWYLIVLYYDILRIAIFNLNQVGTYVYTIRY